ncbi:hypothetical protein BDV96DRAFT_591782 [Lophiotrema nucula]|uniref:F-box domain-containing protein n=1 Tax=Lophiotrema nucula TaxID=690887 RepID=A0A6A5YIF7_9PLEO|nr:hypothetical protein BDV96DRAFT_591782 [Lophiotrema nucula]
MNGGISSYLEVTNAALSKHFLSPEILRRRCTLDRGISHYSRSTTKDGVGRFAKLPSELLDAVLGRMDIKSLLVFRATCSRAMAAVDAFAAFRKIKAHAPDVLRMAIAIRTTHLYTTTQLFAKLCQTTCDTCAQPATYIDLLKLRRDCFGIGSSTPNPNYKNVGNSTSPCVSKCAPRLFFEVVQDTGLSPMEVAKLPCFRAVKGMYGRHCLSSAKVFYDEEAASQHSDARSRGQGHTLDMTLELLAVERMRSRYCSVLAPFLSPTSEGGERLSFCPVGMKMMMERYEDGSRIGRGHNLAGRKNIWAYTVCEDFLDMKLYGGEQLVEHLMEKHGGIEG